MTSVGKANPDSISTTLRMPTGTGHAGWGQHSAAARRVAGPTPPYVTSQSGSTSPMRPAISRMYEQSLSMLSLQTSPTLDALTLVVKPQTPALISPLAAIPAPPRRRNEA